MATSAIKAENMAIQELEDIFANAGWSDGWAMDDKEVRGSQTPLFYRNSTPSVAPDSKVIIDGQSHMLYCIYNVVEDNSYYSSNRPMAFNVTLALTFYYDDSNIFYENKKYTNKFQKFLSNLMDLLADGLFVISSQGESSVPSPSDGDKYIHRKILFIEKLY